MNENLKREIKTQILGIILSLLFLGTGVLVSVHLEERFRSKEVTVNIPPKLENPVARQMMIGVGVTVSFPAGKARLVMEVSTNQRDWVPVEFPLKPLGPAETVYNTNVADEIISNLQGIFMRNPEVEWKKRAEEF